MYTALLLLSEVYAFNATISKQRPRLVWLGGYFMARERDREDASCTRNIPDAQAASIVVNELPGNRQAEAKARTIGAILLKRLKHATCQFGADPAAVVGNLNQDMFRGGMTRKDDVGMRMSEFERVLQ